MEIISSMGYDILVSIVGSLIVTIVYHQSIKKRSTTYSNKVINKIHLKNVSIKIDKNKSSDI